MYVIPQCAIVLCPGGKQASPAFVRVKYFFKKKNLPFAEVAASVACCDWEHQNQLNVHFYYASAVTCC